MLVDSGPRRGTVATGSSVGPESGSAQPVGPMLTHTASGLAPVALAATPRGGRASATRVTGAASQKNHEKRAAAPVRTDARTVLSRCPAPMRADFKPLVQPQLSLALGPSRVPLI